MNCFKQMDCAKSISFGFATMLALLVAGEALCAAEPQRLTHDGAFKFSPVFTDGGQAIVYSVHNQPNRVSLMRLRFPDDEPELLDPTLSAHQLDADLSADGRYVCFALTTGSPQSILVVRDLQEKTESHFKPEGARSTVRGPRISPDNQRIVFTLSAPGGQQIASVDMACRNLTRLTESVGTNCWPAISPDGKQIAFSSSRGGNFDIYVMNRDGSEVHRLTRHPLRDMHPAWSPDGEHIAFTSTRDGNHEIYKIGKDGKHLQRITNHADRDDYPVWHPDGKRLLIVAERAGDTDLYFIPLHP